MRRLGAVYAMKFYFSPKFVSASEFSPAISWCSHARAKAQARSAVRGEMSSMRAASALEKPAKYRRCTNSTACGSTVCRAGKRHVQGDQILVNLRSDDWHVVDRNLIHVAAALEAFFSGGHSQPESAASTPPRQRRSARGYPTAARPSDRQGACRPRALAPSPAAFAPGFPGPF